MQISAATRYDQQDRTRPGVVASRPERGPAAAPPLVEPPFRPIIDILREQWRDRISQLDREDLVPAGQGPIGAGTADAASAAARYASVVHAQTVEDAGSTAVDARQARLTALGVGEVEQVPALAAGRQRFERFA